MPDGMLLLNNGLSFNLHGVATAPAGVLLRIGGIFLGVGVPLFFTNQGAAIAMNLSFIYWIAVAEQLLMSQGLIVLGATAVVYEKRAFLSIDTHSSK